MAELTVEEMEQQSVAVLPERAALGLTIIKVKAYNSAEAYQAWTLLSKNTAVAAQTIVIGG